MTTKSEQRLNFLLRMYDQLCSEINTHILVVWQSIAAIVGAFTILALVEKNIISFHIAVSLIFLICGWSIAHSIDAGYWYNRNLAIITNIEKQFLLKTDVEDIHYYFGKTREENKMILHLKIQLWFASAIMALMLIYHFYSTLKLVVCAPTLDFAFLFPYGTLIVVLITLLIIKRDRDKSYKNFITNSPGKFIDVGDIDTSLGHGNIH